MKIIVISDSHGNKKGISEIFEKIKFDYLFYLGDGLQDLGSYINLDNVIAVSGNCDYFSDVENELDFSINGIKFFITHGNAYGVKYGLEKLQRRARELGVQIVCFGHTHRYTCEFVDGIYHINPGSFRHDNNGLIINIDNGEISILDLSI